VTHSNTNHPTSPPSIAPPLPHLCFPTPFSSLPVPLTLSRYVEDYHNIASGTTTTSRAWATSALTSSSVKGWTPSPAH
jgi:hypothetical protein